MAEDKKSFLLYADYIELFSELSDEDAGKLIKVVFSYVNDQNPVIDDKLINISFIPIKLQLKRDLKKYEYKRELWSEAGRKSAEARALKKANEEQIKLTESTDVKSVPTESTVNVTVTDTVTVTVNDTVTDIKEKKEKADFLSKIIVAFQECYFDVFQVEYSIMAKGKERAAAGTLLKSYKSKYPKSTSEETIQGLRDYFESCCQIPDPWLQKNMSLPIIVSKFNEINNSIKNGRNTRVRSIASQSDEIDRLVKGVFDAKGLS